MENNSRLVGYVRLSFDEDKQNYDSIINQRNMIKEYARKNFGSKEIAIYEDDNFSGYKFNRPDFLRMKQKALQGEIDIIIAKDLSRIGRHNARTLLFVEEMQELDVRVICLNGDVDTDIEGYDEVLGVKTWVNERTVKEASKKVRAVIKHKQKIGEWVCAVPYGYTMIDAKKQIYEVDPITSQIVKEIYDLYLDGWGYKRIANYLTDKNIPTPRMVEKMKKEARGEPCKIKAGIIWSLVSISGILDNDFYIGRLRTGKYARKTINGSDVRTDEGRHNIFENSHESIISEKVFNAVQMAKKSRTTNNYRGTKKYDNVYSGLVFCGDCGSPMFSISNPKRPNAYMCGTYHKRGRKGCTSHHIQETVLMEVVKKYVKRVKENSDDIIEELNKELKKTEKEQSFYDVSTLLKRQLLNAKEELKGLKKQKARESMKDNVDLETLDEIYAEMENEAVSKIYGLQGQLTSAEVAKKNKNEFNKMGIDALAIFDKILRKDRLNKVDLEFIIEKIIVYESGLEMRLRSDIESIFNNSMKSDESIDFEEINVDQAIPKRAVKSFSTNISNVIREGDPLEIFTDREGEIILKKYSPIGELGAFAKEYAESLAQTAGHITCIVDKDQVIAVSGGGKREFLEKHISPEMEKCINHRVTLIANKRDSHFVPLLNDDTVDSYDHQLVAPIIAEGDALGAIVFLSKDAKMGEVEGKLAQTAAGFLGKQMEQ